jgi:RNA polymerase sigma-70 factor (ECF subfamily)
VNRNIRLFRPRSAGNDSAPGDPRPGAGHADAFRTLILPHLDGAYNFARYLTRDPVLSEDVVQDAFIRAFKAFPQFRGGSAKAWLFTIVRNCSRSSMSAGAATRLHAVHDAALSEQDRHELQSRPAPEPDPEQALIERQSADEVRQLLNSLPEPFREALILREFEDLSYKEIAEVTGVAIGTVMSRLARARSILAGMVSERAANETRSSG